MSTEEALQRQIGINLQLRRKLEDARRDAVEECAKFCEENAVTDTANGIILAPTRFPHSGHQYAKGLRAMINQG